MAIPLQQFVIDLTNAFERLLDARDARLEERMSAKVEALLERRPPRGKRAGIGPVDGDDDKLVLYTRPEVAAILRVQLRTVQTLVSEGRLRTCSNNRSRISRFELQRYLAESGASQPPAAPTVDEEEPEPSNPEAEARAVAESMVARRRKPDRSERSDKFE